MKLVIEKIVHGGLGLARDDAGAVLTPFVAAGEEVRGELEPGGKGRRARLVEVLKPSPARVEPPCPLYGRCGGCQLQHLAYDEQLRAKLDILLDALARIGGLTPPEPRLVGAPAPLHYRSRVRLHVRRGVAGFIGVRQSEFVPVSRCLLAAEELNAALPALPPLLRRERPNEVELCAAPDGVLVKLQEDRLFLWTGPGKTGEAGKTGAAEFQPVRRPVAFTQVNHAQNEALRREVAALVDETGPARVLELYAGSGNLTAAIARDGRRIVALDAESAAVELGRRELAGAPGAVRFLCMPAAEVSRERRGEDFFPGGGAAEEPERAADLVLLDPPRAGAREALAGILRACPRRIVYVSCDPATLARDLKELTSPASDDHPRPAYRLSSLILIDMFPQTAHLETVAALDLEQ